MKKLWVWVLLIIVVLGGWFYFKKNPQVAEKTATKVEETADKAVSEVKDALGVEKTSEEHAADAKNEAAAAVEAAKQGDTEEAKQQAADAVQSAGEAADKAVQEGTEGVQQSAEDAKTAVTEKVDEAKEKINDAIDSDPTASQVKQDVIDLKEGVKDTLDGKNTVDSDNSTAENGAATGPAEGGKDETQPNP